MNQLEESLVAQRLVYVAVNNAGGVDKVTVSKSMMQYTRNANSRYKEELEAQRMNDKEKAHQAEKSERR